MQLLKDVVAASAANVPLVIGGDFNATPSEVACWLEDFPEMEVVSAGSPT